MPFYPEERIALFIDGSNLYSSARNLGFDIDYKQLLVYFHQHATDIANKDIFTCKAPSLFGRHRHYLEGTVIARELCSRGNPGSKICHFLDCRGRSRGLGHFQLV